MGQKVTLDLKGRLQLSIDGLPLPTPLDAEFNGMQIDLARLMEQGDIKLIDGEKAVITLRNITIWFPVPIDEILSRGKAAIVGGLEREMGK